MKTQSNSLHFIPVASETILHYSRGEACANKSGAFVTTGAGFKPAPTHEKIESV